MSGSAVDLEKIFESVADGESVDWDALERAAPDEKSRALLRQLRLIAEVSEVHRSQIDEVDTLDPADTGPVGWAGDTRTAAPRPSTADDSPMPQAGKWGHLVLVRKIGEGSYGEVYHAHDTWLDHPVALKLLKPEAESRVQPSDLLHEARKLARVRHINVVTVHGADRHNGRVGFWMDLIDGETLAARVAKGRLSSGEATSVGQEVCRALAAVHRVNIIHRDVKAQNVMRAHDGGRIILMDFGAGEFLGDALGARAQGTPLYLAPELLNGESATVRTDIYAAGVLLYHLVTGRFPVEAASPAVLSDAHRRGDRRRLRDERPDLPESFIAIVERAIDPDPAKRYASAGAMEAKLSGEPVSRPVTVTVSKPAAGATASDYAKRAAIATAGAIALTMVLGFIATRFFDVVLRVDRAFSLGIAETFAVGAGALLPFIAMWLLGGAVLGALAAGALFLGGSLSGARKRLVALSGRWDPVTTAAVIVVAGVALWFVLNRVLFADYFEPVLELPNNPSTPVTILGPAYRSLHMAHYFLSAYAGMAFGLIAWRWFPHLERRSASSSAVRLWKWGAVAIAFAFLAWAVVPRRLVWERYPVVEFGDRSGLVIGSAGSELLVYAPDEPGRPRLTLRSDTPGLRRTGETRLLFDVPPPK
jgi:hypothetical protein